MRLAEGDFNGSEADCDLMQQLDCLAALELALLTTGACARRDGKFP
jgi:hypothetical protein